MGKWTERIFEKSPGGEPTEPTKLGFDGFEGTAPGAFEKSPAGDSIDSPAAAPMAENAEPTETQPDDGPTSEIWRVWTPAPGGGFYDVDAIRPRRVTAREILLEFPDAVQIRPILPKGESITVEDLELMEDKT